MAEISGTVTLDGNPLNDAVVQVDAGDGAVPTSLPISEGQFAGEVLLGKKTLRFFAMRKTERDPRLRAIDMQAPEENVLPDRYGYDSTFTIEVPAAGIQGLVYELTSN